MNQIVILGVALLIAYSAGVPVNEQTTRNPILDELDTISLSVNSTLSSWKDKLCVIHEAVFIGKDVCQFSCGNGCKFPFCGGFDSCKPLGRFTHQCLCKLSDATQSNNELTRPLTNSNGGKAPKDFLSNLAQNEQNVEVAANH